MTHTVRRVVIADAGPLIGLARIGRLSLLPQLFGTVSVTKWVADEVLAGGDFADIGVLKAAFVEPWLQTVAVVTAQADIWQTQCAALINLHQIDMGEATALVLAQQLTDQGDAPLLLMDDHRGRQAAQHSKIATMGTAGVLLLAKQANAIAAVKPVLQALRENGYFLSNRLIDAVLAQAGE